MSSSADVTTPPPPPFTAVNATDRPMFAYWDDLAAVNLVRLLGGLLGLGTNIFLLYLIFTTKLRNHQYNWYLSLLSLADICIAIGLFVRATYAFYCSSLGTVLFSKWSCVLVNTPLGMGFTLTRVAVLAIGADRLYMVIYPLTYRSRSNMPLFSLVALLGLLVVSMDTFTKLYNVDRKMPTTLCSMGSSAGPLSAIFGQFFSNSCLALLFAIYIPFLCIYRHKSAPVNSISSSWHWKRQLQVTGTTVWLLCLYASLWGGSFGLLAMKNYMQNPQIYSGTITYAFGFLSSMCSWSSLFVYLLKHEEIRKQAPTHFCRLFGLKRPLNKVGVGVGVSRHQMFSLSLDNFHQMQPAAGNNQISVNPTKNHILPLQR